jgi:hypothetical protein
MSPAMTMEEFAPVEAETKPRPFTVWAPSKFMDYVAPEGSVILGDSVLERRKLATLIGPPGIGKTRWALWLAFCQILGWECCGLKTHGKPLRWLILSTENGLRRWQTDLKAMMARLDANQRALIEENLKINALTDDDDFDLNAGNVEAMHRLEATLQEVAPDCIIFDPFADIVDGDENKNSDVVKTLRVLRSMLKKYAPNAAALVIHHSRTGAGNVGQAGDNFNTGNYGRGGKALVGHVRGEIQMAPGDRDDGNKIVLACGKNSDGPKFVPRGIVFNPEDFSYTVDPSWSLDDWRADVNGQRTDKAVTINDAVEAVRELAPYQGNEAQTGDIVEKMKGWTGAGIRTCKARMAEAKREGYLRDGTRRGLYRLGFKDLKK